MPVPSHAQEPLAGDELEIKSILLVDDDEELADTLKEILEARNFVVTKVSNGADALHEVLDLDFDVIICDMLMPTMPGDMFFLAVRKTKPHLANRFLFITGHSGNPKVDGFLKSVDALVIFKPVDMDELMEMISLIIQQTSAN